MTEELESFTDDDLDGRSYFLDPTARIVGDVMLGEGSFLGDGTIIDSSESEVEIGEDVFMLHKSKIEGKEGYETKVEDGTFISPKARLKGCELGEESFVGTNAVILEGAKIGKESIIAGDTIVPEGMDIPERSVVRGKPGKVVDKVKDEDLERIKEIRSHIDWKKDEFKMMMKRGEQFDVFDTPKRPKEIMEEFKGSQLKKMNKVNDDKD
ncbi:MAG: gamma carbonic anhydrase family protein [Thermoplasmatota archaeon]